MKWLWIFVLLMFVPFTLAFQCEDTHSPEWCNEIQQSNLSDDEKSYLLADLVSPTKFHPDHLKVALINDRTPIRPKEGQSSRFIENAWVRIGGVEPSVQVADSLLTPPEGRILAGSDYRVNIVQSLDPGDCDTRRRLTRDEQFVTYKINDEVADPVYSLNLADQTPLEIKAVSRVEISVAVDHYTLQKPCKLCKPVCAYSFTQIENDRLVVQDSLDAVYYDPAISAFVTTQDSHQGTVKNTINATELVNLRIFSEEASYTEHYYSFSEIERDSGFLQQMAIYQPSTELNNVVVSQDALIMPHSEQCKIEASSFFVTKTFNCEQEARSLALTVETNKLIYTQNETVNLKIFPKGSYEVEYDNQVYNTTGQISLNATYLNNRITISNGQRTINKVIHVTNQAPIKSGGLIGIITVLNSVIVGIIRRWGGIFG